MKWILYVQHKGNTASKWDEDYNDDDVNSDEDAETKGKAMIDRFNATLRPNEKEREFVGAKVVEENSASLAHVWHKTNAMTIIDRSGTYDKQRCYRCGITGKRFGISNAVSRDAEFKARGFEFCDTAQVLLAKRKAKKESRS